MTVHCSRLCCSKCVVEYSSYKMSSLFEMGGISLFCGEVRGSKQSCGVYFERVTSM